jgi:hypothetical protein
METQEYRGRCTGDGYRLRVMTEGPCMSVSGQKSGTTCTVTFYTGDIGDYCSKSCTNWNVIESDKVHPKVYCKRRCVMIS